MKCLIVEDNVYDGKLLKQMLQKYCHCDIVDNGTRAVTIYRQSRENEVPYDVVFLDIMMPDMSGEAVLKEIRDWETRNLALSERVKIVMATSKIDTDTIVESFDNGAQYFLMKPYDKNELEELIQYFDFDVE